MVTNIWLGGILVVLAVLVAIGLSAVLRWKAPSGGFFSDSDRAGSIFASIATMFSVLLALVVLLSVETYKQTESHANAEADAVLEQFQLAQLFPSNDQYTVQSQLICYGRSVIEDEWHLMRNDQQSLVVDEWGGQIDSTIDSVAVEGGKADAGFRLFLEQTLKRQEERRGRLEGAGGTLPSMVWPILLLGAVSILAYIIYYADSAERLTTQALQVGLVTALLGSSLVLISALDHPFNPNPGQIQPEKMEGSLRMMQNQISGSIDSPGLEATLPCDQAGIPKSSDPVVRSFPEGSTMAEIVERGTIRIGVSHNISLFGEMDPVSGIVSGFDADLAREIAREMGLREDQIEFVDTRVEDRIPHLQDGRLDLVVLVMTITPERNVLVDFSRPYYLAGQSILVERDRRPFTSLRDMGEHRVCVVPESTSAQTLISRSPETELIYHPTWNGCLGALNRAEVDAISTDDIVLAGFAAANNDLVLVGGQFTQEPYGVAAPKGDTDLVNFVDDVIERMIDDGRWGKLYYQYLGDIPGLAPVDVAKDRLPSSVLD